MNHFHFSIKLHGLLGKVKQRVSHIMIFLLVFELIVLVDDLHCPKNWSRFLHLCYYLSKYMSMVGQANRTCSVFNLNDSRLMYVKNPLEVLYAAHVMNKNSINEFLLEIDPNLMKGKQKDENKTLLLIRWEDRSNIIIK